MAAMSYPQVLLVLLWATLCWHHVVAVRNCHHPGADYVTDAELEEYCDRVHYAYKQYNSVSVPKENLINYMEDAQYVAIAHVTNLTRRNITTNGFYPDKDDVLHPGCTLTQFKYIMEVENMCVLKYPSDTPQITRTHESDFDCPLGNMTVGRTYIITSNSFSVPQEEINGQLWKRTFHYTPYYIVEWTPALGEKVGTFCGLQEHFRPASNAPVFKNVCPNITVTKDTCISSSASCVLVNTLIVVMLAALLSHRNLKI